MTVAEMEARLARLKEDRLVLQARGWTSTSGLDWRIARIERQLREKQSTENASTGSQR